MVESGILVAILCGIMVLIIFRLGEMPTLYEFLLSLSFLWVLLLALWLVRLLNNKYALKRGWENQPFLARPHIMEVSQSGITLSEPQSRHEYNWSALAGFRETPDLLLLYPTIYMHWIIPKRAFATRAELEAFKGFLMTHLEGEFLPATSQAFPIVPVSTSASGNTPALSSRNHAS